MTVPGAFQLPERVAGLIAAAVILLRLGFVDHAPSAADAWCAAAAFLVVLGLGSTGPPPASRVCAICFIAAAGVSLPTSITPWTSLLALPVALGSAGFFLLGAGNARSAACIGLLAGGALHGATALWQRFVLWPDALARQAELGLPPSIVQRLQSGRTIGLSLSPDLAGGLGIAAATAGVALLVVHRRGLRAALLLCGTTLSLAAVVLSRSSGCALALAVAGAATIAALLLRRRNRSAVVGGAGVALVVVAAGGMALTRGVPALLHSAQERLANWEVGMRLFGEHPLLGVGFARFAPAYLAARPPDANVTRYAHSLPVTVMSEGGIVASFVIVIAAGLILRSWWHTARVGTVDRLVLLAGALAVVARCFIDYDAQIGQSAAIIGLLLGLAWTQPTDDPHPWDRRGRALLRVGVVFTVIVGLVVGWRDAAVANPTASSPLERIDVDVALARSSATSDPRARIELLSPLVDTAHPTPVAALLRARARADLADLAGALEDVERALRADPGNAGAHQMAVALAEAGLGDPVGRKAAAARWRVAIE